jgi:NADH-quinone oxidoreductase subunit E
MPKIQTPHKAELLNERRAEIDARVRRIPADQRSAVMARCAPRSTSTGLAQPEMMDAVAAYLGMPPIAGLRGRDLLLHVRTRSPWAATSSRVHQPACMLRGGRDRRAPRAEARHRIGESTPDGKFYLKREEECLAPAAARR